MTYWDKGLASLVVGWRLPSVSGHVNFSSLLYHSKHVGSVSENMYDEDGKHRLL